MGRAPVLVACSDCQASGVFGLTLRRIVSDEETCARQARPISHKKPRSTALRRFSQARGSQFDDVPETEAPPKNPC